MNETTYEIWMAGHLVSGMEGHAAKASFEGRFVAASFEDACAEWAKTTSDPALFNRERLTFWGCRLFDNESDARVAFG